MDLGFILLIALVIPFVILFPVLIWAGVVSGLYALIRDKVRRKSAARQKQTNEEALVHKTVAR